MKPFDIHNEKYHMGHLFLDAMKSRPDDICQLDAATGESETNASVRRRSEQLARCLRRFGTRPGDVLALGGRNHLDTHIPYYAALLNGMPIAGVDPQFKYTEIKTHFKVSAPRVAFCQKEQIDDHLQVIKELGLDTKLICFDDGDYSLKRFIEEYDDNKADEELEPLDFDVDKIYAWLVSTGGTTGVVKLAAFKHRTFILKMIEIQKLFASKKTDEKRGTGLPMTLHLSPVQWISAYFNAICLPFMKQVKLFTSAPATTEHIIDIINKYRPVSAMMGPSLATAIIKSDKECDLTCFENVMLTGSKIHKDIILELRRRNVKITEAYGQTENLGPIFIPDPSGPIGTCGKSYYPWHKMKLVDPETGKEIKEPNTPGEVWTKGDCFSEYYNNPEETRNAFTEDGWYRTGDILYFDENGYFFFVERLKMLIKCRNYHIVPPELEAVIREHPGVQDVSVTSVPDEDDGEHPVACVVRSNGSNVTAQEIKDLVANKLSDSQRLRGGVVFMDAIPLTTTGKVARGKLRQIVLTAHRE